jgi:hypothetical protein
VQIDASMRIALLSYVAVIDRPLQPEGSATAFSLLAAPLRLLSLKLLPQALDNLAVYGRIGLPGIYPTLYALCGEHNDDHADDA